MSWLCQKCQRMVPEKYTKNCPFCGEPSPVRQVGECVIDVEGLTRRIVGRKYTKPLFRVCHRLADRQCGIAFWDGYLRKEIFFTTEELESLIKKTCK